MEITSHEKSCVGLFDANIHTGLHDGAPYLLTYLPTEQFIPLLKV